VRRFPPHRLTDYLTPERIAAAFAVGDVRQDTAERERRVHRYPNPDPRENNRQAACAEDLGSAITGKPWTGRVATPDIPRNGADIGTDTGVRWTRKLDGELRIYPWDNNALAMLLCVGLAPDMLAVGWRNVGASKLPEWWDEEAGFWKLRQELLLPIEYLTLAAYSGRNRLKSAA
jgi:hypothetical protein